MKISHEEIKEKLAFAAGIMRRLPSIKVRGYFCAWPKFCADEDDILTEGDAWLEPLPHEISAMEEILEWLAYTTVEKRRILWLRACQMGWKQICARTHKGRSTLAREYFEGLNDIQKALEDDQNYKKTTYASKLDMIRD